MNDVIDSAEGTIVWNTFTNDVPILEKEIHVFKIEVKKAFEKIAPYFILSNEEREKGDKFRQAKDQQSYVVSKHYLRIVLARITDTDPSAIFFSKTGRGKPSLPDIEFNMSHSDNYILIIVSHVPVGIDVEYINHEFEFNDLLPYCFDRQESEYVRTSLDPLASFYKIWTRKEAYLKATGIGLIEDLKSIKTLNPTVTNNATSFTLKTLSDSRGYVFSIAHQGTTQMLYKYFEMDQY